jgi:hypothetical protein
MTPTLLDVVMLTGLDISSSCPSAFSAIECPFHFNFKADAGN